MGAFLFFVGRFINQAMIPSVVILGMIIFGEGSGIWKFGCASSDTGESVVVFCRGAARLVGRRG